MKKVASAGSVSGSMPIVLARVLRMKVALTGVRLLSIGKPPLLKSPQGFSG
jgi:hypothetical protein